MTALNAPAEAAGGSHGSRTRTSPFGDVATAPDDACDAAWLGVDVGGTAVKWMCVSESGLIRDEGTEPTREPVVAHVSDLAARLVEAHPTIRGVGVICPGLVDEARGEVVFASNLDLAGARLALAVEERTGRPARLGHDGRAAGLAESLLGAGRGAASWVMMPIGTGISVALGAGDTLWSGATFSAGEVGHTPIFPGGEECACGQRGCLEVYASATGIARRYARLAGQDVGARGVEARLGTDPIADEVWGTAVEALALSLTQLTLAVDPERIIIGGGLSRAGEVLFAPLRERLGDMLRFREAPAVVGAQLGDRAGSWGAAIIASLAGDSRDHEQWVA